MAKFECWNTQDEMTEPGQEVVARSAQRAAEAFVSDQYGYGEDDTAGCFVADEDGDVYEFECDTRMVVETSNEKLIHRGTLEEMRAELGDGT